MTNTEQGSNWSDGAKTYEEVANKALEQFGPLDTWDFNTIIEVNTATQSIDPLGTLPDNWGRTGENE